MMKWCVNKDLGLLIIRLSLAMVFIYAGVNKLMTIEQTVGFFGSIGVPALLAYMVIAVEILAGVAMLLGVFVRYAGILLALVMVGAIYLVKAKMGFAAAQIDLVLLASALGIAMIGAGKWSLESKLMGKNCDGCETVCANGVCSSHE